MKFGIIAFPTDYSMDIGELARACEDRGLESLWFPDHTHIPTSRRTPRPAGGELSKQYWHILDPLVALTAAAAATSRLLLGTGICLVPQRDPIVLAKQVASLDYLSKGRFLFGVGGGWNREEIENHGIRYSARWRLMRERILAMKQIWTQDEPEFHGEFVDFDPIWSWPKPFQKPHPPIIVGGDGPTTFARVLEYGDGWMPIHGRSAAPIEERIREVGRLTEAAGRAPVPVTIFYAPPDLAIINNYRHAGVARLLFNVGSGGPDEVIPQLDQVVQFAN
jgi:probable F420-dependent oxidoreductase